MKFRFLLLLMLSCTTVFAQDNMQSVIDNVAHSYLSKKSASALVVGIVTPDRAQTYFYGETDKGNGIRPDEGSLFELGNLSSVFTTSLLSILESEQQADLNDKVQDYFPQSVIIPTYQEIVCKPVEKNPLVTEKEHHTMYYCFADPSYHPKQMLLCDLATNTSGLPLYPSNLPASLKSDHPFAGYTLVDLYGFLNNYRTTYPTGLRYHFSPLGIAMLGNALAWKEETSFEELLQQKLLHPLALQNTFVASEMIQLPARLPGHDKNGKVVSPGNFGAMSPAVGIVTNITDLMIFMQANLGLISSPLQQPLWNTQNPRVAIGDHKKWKGSYSALAWLVTPLTEDNAVNITWQHGTTGGYAAYFGLIRERKMGVVILSNSNDPVEDLGDGLVHMLYKQLETSMIPDSSSR